MTNYPHLPQSARTHPVKRSALQGRTAQRARRLFGAAMAFSLLALTLAPAAAQEWPSRPIRLIAPFSPGAATDFVSRALAQKLSEQLGQPVVVDNKPGASGTIAVELATKAAPDGYTILFGEPGGIAAAPAVSRTQAFDSLRDLIPVAQAVSMPMVVVAHPSLGAKDLRELAVIGRTRTLDYGTNGIGSVQHLTMEFLAPKLGIKMVHIPYKGGALAINDLIAGQIPLSLLTVPTAAPHIKAGKIVALGVLDARRSPLLPDLATATEQGLGDASVPIWGGFFVPARTPRAIADRLSAEIQKALTGPELRQKLAGAGNDVLFRDSAAFSDLVQRDVKQWQAVVKASGITPD